MCSTEGSLVLTQYVHYSGQRSGDNIFVVQWTF